MKKIVSLFLFVSIVLSFSVTGFAQETNELTDVQTLQDIYDSAYLIGEAQSIEPNNIVRIFDKNGTQLSTDGEFNSVVFNESEYGIACKVEMGVIDLETKCWLVNKDGKKVSYEYDSIQIKENNEFFGVKNNTETKIVVLE